MDLECYNCYISSDSLSKTYLRDKEGGISLAANNYIVVDY